MELFIKYPVGCCRVELLMRLLQTAKSTEFGEQHDFAKSSFL